MVKAGAGTSLLAGTSFTPPGLVLFIQTSFGRLRILPDIAAT